MSFKEFLLESKVTVKVEKYSWGNLATVTNRSYTAVLHPEHIEGLINLEEDKEFKFEDEQKIKWVATIKDNVVLLKSGSKKLSFDIDEIEGKL